MNTRIFAPRQEVQTKVPNPPFELPLPEEITALTGMKSTNVTTSGHQERNHSRIQK